MMLRRVAGDSMLPTLKPGQIVIATRHFKPQVGQIIVVQHRGIQKIKRLTSISDSGFFVEGDNAKKSTDSRHFGAVDHHSLQALVIWPRYIR